MLGWGTLWPSATGGFYGKCTAYPDVLFRSDRGELITDITKYIFHENEA